MYKVANDRLVAIADRNANLSLLVRAVAHEINNTSGLIPANVIGIRKLIGVANERIDRKLSLIQDAANQATEFANKVAGLAPNRMGDKGPLDINEVVRDAMEALDLSHLENAQAVKLKVFPCETPLVCEVYRTQFTQLIRNIIINAYQALQSTRRGVVTVTTSKGVGGWVGCAAVEIKDNGPGIKLEDQGRIFEPDFTTKVEGSGLGLWLVRTQLDFIGGKIRVESEFGRGASFIITVPLVGGAT